MQRGDHAMEDGKPQKERLAQALIEASRSGELGTVVTRVFSGHPGETLRVDEISRAAPSSEATRLADVRQKAQQALCEAVLTGKLQEAVVTAKVENLDLQQKATRLTDLREKAQQALCEATLTGKLEQAVVMANGETPDLSQKAPDSSVVSPLEMPPDAPIEEGTEIDFDAIDPMLEPAEAENLAPPEDEEEAPPEIIAEMENDDDDDTFAPTEKVVIYVKSLSDYVGGCSNATPEDLSMCCNALDVDMRTMLLQHLNAFDEKVERKVMPLEMPPDAPIEEGTEMDFDAIDPMLEPAEAENLAPPEDEDEAPPEIIAEIENEDEDKAPPEKIAEIEAPTENDVRHDPTELHRKTIRYEHRTNWKEDLQRWWMSLMESIGVADKDDFKLQHPSSDIEIRTYDKNGDELQLADVNNVSEERFPVSFEIRIPSKSKDEASSKAVSEIPLSSLGSDIDVAEECSRQCSVHLDEGFDSTAVSEKTLETTRKIAPEDGEKTARENTAEITARETTAEITAREIPAEITAEITAKNNTTREKKDKTYEMSLRLLPDDENATSMLYASLKKDHPCDHMDVLLRATTDMKERVPMQCKVDLHSRKLQLLPLGPIGPPRIIPLDDNFSVEQLGLTDIQLHWLPVGSKAEEAEEDQEVKIAAEDKFELRFEEALEVSGAGHERANGKYEYSADVHNGKEVWKKESDPDYKIQWSTQCDSWIIDYENGPAPYKCSNPNPSETVPGDAEWTKFNSNGDAPNPRVHRVEGASLLFFINENDQFEVLAVADALSELQPGDIITGYHVGDNPKANDVTFPKNDRVALREALNVLLSSDESVHFNIEGRKRKVTARTSVVDPEELARSLKTMRFHVDTYADRVGMKDRHEPENAKDFHIGECVECRMRDSGQEWAVGVVTSLDPLTVQTDGLPKSHEWDEVRKQVDSAGELMTWQDIIRRPKPALQPLPPALQSSPYLLPVQPEYKSQNPRVRRYRKCKRAAEVSAPPQARTLPTNSSAGQQNLPGMSFMDPDMPEWLRREAKAARDAPYARAPVSPPPPPPPPPGSKAKKVEMYSRPVELPWKPKPKCFQRGRNTRPPWQHLHDENRSPSPPLRSRSPGKASCSLPKLAGEEKISVWREGMVNSAMQLARSCDVPIGLLPKAGTFVL